MKLRDVGLCLMGGSILYVSMAACAGRPAGNNGTRGTTSGGGSGGIAVHNGGGGGAGGASTGATGTSGGGSDGGLTDALTDPVPSAHADPAPGSRLKPKFRLGDDGAKEYLGGVWWDSDRNEDCSFAVAADGKTRCLPKGSDFRYFADAQCATPMVLTQGTCSAPKYGISNVEAACGLDAPATKVFAIGGATNPPMIYGKSGSSCFAIGPTTPDWTYYTVGAEIPASSFVAGNIGHD